MKIKRFQEGGAAPAPAEQAPAQPDEQMVQQLAQMAQEIIQQLGPDAAAMLAQILMEMLQGGAQQPVGEVPQEQQFMRRGGKIEKVSKACGGRKLKNGCKIKK